MKKRILCMLLCIALLVGALPTAVFAANDTVTANGTEVSVSGINSVGNLLAKSLDGDGNDTDAYNSLQDITVENGAATVLFSAFEDAELVVAIYDEGTGRLTTSGKAAVHKDDTKATIMLETSEIPQYFTAEAFLLSADDYTPLCESFSTPMYTKAFQELLNSSCNDFETDRVLNLDESKDTNFAVYADDVKRSESNGTTNTVLSADDTALRYVINNPDSTVTSLQPGEFWSCEDGENVLIVKVASVTLQGNQAIITGQETSMEEVFDYAKIEGAADAEDAVIDPSQMAEGVTYNGMTDMDDTPATRAWSGEESLKTGWSFSLYKEIKGEQASAKLNLSLSLSVTSKLKYYIAKSDSYISFTQEYKMAVKGKLENKLKLCEIPLTVVPIIIPVCGIINLEVEPNLVAEVSATVSVETSIVWSIGLTYEQGKGFTNTSTKPTTDAEFAIEGTLFIGASVKVKFCIISSNICSIGVGFEAGAEVNAKLTGRERENGKLHFCDGCFDGTIHIVLKLKASADMFKYFKIEKTLAEYKHLLGNFYNSITYHEGGWGDCPHWYDASSSNEQTFYHTDSIHDGDQVVIYHPSQGIAVSQNQSTTGWGKAGEQITVSANDTIVNPPSSIIWNAVVDNGIIYFKNKNGDVLSYGNTENNHWYLEYNALYTGWYLDRVREGVVYIRSAVLNDGLQRYMDWYPEYQYFSTYRLEASSQKQDFEFSIYTCTNLQKNRRSLNNISPNYTSVGAAVFRGTGLANITIPDSVTSIGDYAFHNCTELTGIYFCGDAPDISTDAFDEVTASAYYPAGNSTWRDSVKQNYGGNLTWIEWTPTKGIQATTATASPETRSLHTGEQNGNIVSFTGLTAGEQYVLIVSKNKSSDLLERNNLLYIAQAPAGEDGTLQFTMVPRESYADAFIGLYGKGASSPEQTPCDGGADCPSGKFIDVNPKQWYHPYVDYAVTHGLFGGTSANTFEPETAMTRAMLVTVLWRYEGQPKGYQNTFVDVNAKSGSWYIDAVAWAAENGIVGGVGNNRFDPDGEITREQMATILFRYAEKKGIDTSKRGSLNIFSDEKQLSAYAKDAVQWAVAEQIINGSDGKLLPQGSATRAQVATILMRFIENIVKK